MNVASDPSSATASRPARVVGFVAFVGIFTTVLAYFGLLDPYRSHFFLSGQSAIYNIARVVFAAYLFWLFTFIGDKTLATVGQRPLAGIKLHERLALSFFVGG